MKSKVSFNVLLVVLILALVSCGPSTPEVPEPPQTKEVNGVVYEYQRSPKLENKTKEVLEQWNQYCVYDSLSHMFRIVVSGYEGEVKFLDFHIMANGLTKVNGQLSCSDDGLCKSLLESWTLLNDNEAKMTVTILHSRSTITIVENFPVPPLHSIPADDWVQGYEEVHRQVLIYPLEID